MGLGPLEILLIGSWFLLLFGPERLLEVAHDLVLRWLRKIYAALSQELNCRGLGRDDMRGAQKRAVRLPILAPLCGPLLTMMSRKMICSQHLLIGALCPLRHLTLTFRLRLSHDNPWTWIGAEVQADGCVKLSDLRREAWLVQSAKRWVTQRASPIASRSVAVLQ